MFELRRLTPRMTDHPPLRMNLIEYAPVANSATQRSICSFEKFNVPTVRIGAHVLKCIVYVLNIGTVAGREVPRVAGLVSTKFHVMPPFIKRNEIASLIRTLCLR